MPVLTEHRRRRLDEALRLARGAVRALEDGTRASDADGLTLAGQALQEAGKIAARQAAYLGDESPVEPARRLSPMQGGRRGSA